MRTELATIQQMLTPEAAAVLTPSIEEAGRRRHGQTTPLHVAANLLVSPSGILRGACAVSHPLLSSSSHPLHCRALDLCFSVALDRLPAGANSDGSEAEQPPLSNALVAALKRAQAHQRRGCPEQQQQQPPLLAVKVELGQLVVSILDDPSVSRVMREAGFSSPAVKAAIEQSLSSNPAIAANSPSPPAMRSVCMNPRLQQEQGKGWQEAKKKEEVKKVLAIMTREKKRNPVLVGDLEAASVMKEVLTMIEKEELGMDTPAVLRSAQVVSLEKEFMSLERSLIPRKINKLYSFLDLRARGCSINGGMGGLVLDLGDLKWLAESPGGYAANSAQQQQQIGRVAVTEMGRLLTRLREGDENGSRVWAVGTATCATYLRCQIYYPTMEGDWDLQAVPIAPRSPPIAGLFPRSGGNGSLRTAAAPPNLSSAAAVVLSRPLESTNCPQTTALCHLCMEGYQLELTKLVPYESEDHSSKTERDSSGTLPQWLQIAVPRRKSASDHLQTKEQELLQKQKAEELLGKWRGKCTRLHMNPHATVITSERTPAPNFPMLSSINCTILPQQFVDSRLAISGNGSDQSLKLNALEHQISSVKTDLVLGLSQPVNTPSQKPRNECIKDLLSKCSRNHFDDQQSNTIAGISDTGSLQRLLKGLTEAVSWQPEAASAIATAVMRCQSGNGKLRGTASKADLWLLFAGPDKVGKMKMASALSELVFNMEPLRIHLGSPSADGDDGELEVSFRGKTSLDRIAEAIQQNPFSVIVLQGIDHANSPVRGTIKRAIESGRLLDSRGREVTLGSIIFILISDWWPNNLRNSEDCHLHCEDKMLDSANSGWQLELSFGQKSQDDWSSKDEQPRKRRKQSSSQGLSLDLNLALSIDDDDDDAEEGSWNSSDLTVEHEHKYGQLAIDCPTLSNASELIDVMDEAIVFKPVDFSTLRKRVSEFISSKFVSVMGNGRLIKIDEDALDRIVGGVWRSGATKVFDEWADRVLVPSINQLRSNSDVDHGCIVRLSTVKTKSHVQKGSCAGNWLPNAVSIAIDGA